MKVFKAQLRPHDIKKIFLKNNFLTGLLLVLLLLSLSSQAEIKHLFASDIIDQQAEQAIYNSNHVNRYITQRNTVYPEVIRKNSWPANNISVYAPIYPVQNNSNLHTAEHYTNHFGKRIYKQSMLIKSVTTQKNTWKQYGKKYPDVLYVSDIEPDKHSGSQKNKPGPYTFEEQSRQNYPLYVSDIESDKHSDSRKNKPGQYAFGDQGRQRYLYASDIEQDKRSGSQKNKFRPYAFGDQSRQNYPLYVSDIEPDNHLNSQKNKPEPYTIQDQGVQSYPGILYASDFEADKNNSVSRINKFRQYAFQNQQGQLKTRRPSHHIPAPVYSVQRIQSRTISDILNQNDSRFSPYSNYGSLNNILDFQSSSLASLGVFPEQ